MSFRRETPPDDTMSRNDASNPFHSYARACVADRYQCHVTACHPVTSPAWQAAGGEGLERPRHAVVRVEISHRRVINRPNAVRTAGPGLHQLSTRARAPAATDRADTVQTRLPATRGKSRIAAISADRPCDGKSREWLYGRSEATVAVGNAHGRARNQAPGRSRNVEMGRCLRDGPATRPGGGGGGPTLLGCRIIDVEAVSRGSSSQNLGGPAVKNLAAPFSQNPVCGHE
jgi:hypothetical protein